MDFIRRMGIFLVGVSIGLVFLAFFFKNKKTEFCYLPNCRVLKDIRNKEIIISSHLQGEGYSLEVLKPIFFEGEVNFSKSTIGENECNTYLITGTSSRNEKLTLRVDNCFLKAWVTSVMKE